MRLLAKLIECSSRVDRVCSSSFKVIELSGIIEQSARSDGTCVIRAEFRLPSNRNVALTNFNVFRNVIVLEFYTLLQKILFTYSKKRERKKNGILIASNRKKWTSDFPKII